MTREIKFRCWDKKDRLWVAGWLIGQMGVQSDNGNYIFMQWTGLKDKNGKEIYEGDVISVFYNGTVQDCWKAVVKWCGINPMFILERVNPRFTADIEEDFVKCGLLELLVIGNIYENPELLEVKND